MNPTEQKSSLRSTSRTERSVCDGIFGPGTGQRRAAALVSKLPEYILQPTTRQLRQFLVLAGVVIGIVGLYLIHSGPVIYVLVVLCAGLVCLTVGICRPTLGKWLFIGLSLVTWPIGWALSQLVLALIFFGIITPIGLLFRIRKRDLLQLKCDCAGQTLWKTRGAEPRPEDYLKQF